MNLKRYIVKIGRKGRIVITAEIRKIFNIRNRVVIEADDKGIRIIPLILLEELFDVDSVVMREIVRERLEEVKGEE